MTEPAAVSSPSDARKWLARLSRTGGLAANLALGLPLLNGGLLLLQAGLLARILHQAIVGGLDLGHLGITVGLFAAVLLLRILIGLVGEIAATTASETIKLRLRADLVGTILAKPPVWSAARSSGALSGIVVEQVEAMDGYLTRYLPAMAQAALLPLAFAAFILPIDGLVALLFVVSAPLIPVFMALAGWGAQAASERQATALGRLSGRFADRLRGLTTLKLFGREAAETEGVALASEDLRRRTMQVMRIAFLSSAVLEFFAALGVAGVALYVGLTFLDLIHLRGAVPLTLEAGLFCLLMAPEVYQPLRLLAANYHDQAFAKAAVAEIAAQLGELPVAAAPASSEVAPLAESTGPAALVLSQVGIAAPNGRPVVVDAELTLRPGEHIAILGQSGAGKSTLLEAIAGLRPHEGTISLDGSGIAAFPPALLRSRIGVLGQRPTIFAGSIADNIRLGRRDACDTVVLLAARRACVTDFADELPAGLDTQLGENGVGLSGGEIHRIALARLYLRDPGLLLLDEPTAHLDLDTESRVLDGLFEFARGRTMIVVTHSTAVAARLDRCLRIVHGRLLPAPRIVERQPPQRGAA